MPLEPGTSRAAFSHNVKAELAAGKNQETAVAIAYNEKRKSQDDDDNITDSPLGLPGPVMPATDTDERDDPTIPPTHGNSASMDCGTVDCSNLLEAPTVHSPSITPSEVNARNRRYWGG